MEIIKIDSIIVKGLKIRTNNSIEMSASGEIGPLWETMTEKHFPKMLVTSKIYGVYHNYENDMNADYDVLVGSNEFSKEVKSLEEVSINEGKYAKFSADGEMPETCIKLWQKVWAYFSDTECTEERLYTTDFEEYTATGVDIYIAIK